MSRSLWDEHASAEFRVEYTLWAFAALSLGSVITPLAELMFAELNPRDDLVQSVAERLTAIETLLRCFIAERPVDSQAKKHITHLAMVGTSRLRRILHRARYTPTYAEQMAAVLLLVGRLIDLAANLAYLDLNVSQEDRKQIRAIAENIREIRQDLVARRIPLLMNRDPAQLPEIEVEFLPSNETLVGLGEPATTPVAPAVANAIFAATGACVRDPPIRPQAVLEALARGS